MQHFQGIVLSPGFARGNAWVLSPIIERVVPRYEVPEEAREGEVLKLEEGINCSRRGLLTLKAHLRTRVEQAETAVLDAHIAMLEDPVFFVNVSRRIRENGANAEQAVSDEIDEMAAVFAQLNNEYLQERAHDLRDVGRRLVDSLVHPGRDDEVVEIPPDSVLVAHELLPSQAAEIDRTRVVGIVTESGGASSHAAILARALGVPFVSGIPGVVRKIFHQAPLLVDGDTGEVVQGPSAARSRAFNNRKRNYDRFVARATREEKEPSQTLDGVPVSLMANVSTASEAEAVIDHHLGGIGLLRTEFVFMESEEIPSLSKQHRVYEALVKKVGKLPVTIRVMDLGADKMPRFLRKSGAELPSARGLRFALERPSILVAQCRAIIRCSTHTSVKILLPMVAGLEDFERALELIGQAAEQEDLGVPKVGAMIETPGAIFELDDILERADFVSVGTNDLTQYMLAVDREATDAEGFYSVLYPGVLRALRAVIESCRAANRPLAVCGEAAGNPLIAALLVGMGVRELSMSPLRAAAVRHVIRCLSVSELEELAAQVLRTRRIQETKDFLDSRLGMHLQARAD